MTKREAIRQHEQSLMLQSLGFTADEANTLRRISMTLRRWYELECGDGNADWSYAIERDPETDKPYMNYYPHDRNPYRIPVRDREKGAISRLRRIFSDRNARKWVPDIADTLTYYLQTDPRGAALYIIRPGDIPAGEDVSAYYSRGICVY